MTDELTRYEPSGRVGASLVLAWPLALALAAVAARGYEWAAVQNPLVVLGALLPVVLGVLLGTAVAVALVLGQVRSGRIVHLVAWSIAGAGLAAAWWFALGRHGDGEGLAASWRAFAGAGEAPLPLRITGWLIEAVLVVSIAVAMPISWWRRAVFCEDEGRFVPRQRIGVAYGPSPFAFRQAATDAGLEGLARLGLRPLPENDSEGEFRFCVHGTEGGSYLTVFWHGQLDGLRGRKVTRDVLVLRRVLVDQAFLERLLPAASRQEPRRGMTG